MMRGNSYFMEGNGLSLRALVHGIALLLIVVGIKGTVSATTEQPITTPATSEGQFTDATLNGVSNTGSQLMTTENQNTEESLATDVYNPDKDTNDPNLPQTGAPMITTKGYVSSPADTNEGDTVSEMDSTLTTTEAYNFQSETTSISNSSFTSPTVPINSTTGNRSSLTTMGGYPNASDAGASDTNAPDSDIPFTTSIYEVETSTPTDDMSGDAYYCEEGWFNYGNYCYWKSDISERITWPSARVRCQQDGADLVSFHSFEEEQYVIENYLRGASDAQHWIGFHDIHREDAFEWSDGSPVTYIHWATVATGSNVDQPDDWEANYGEDCSQIRLIDYVWNDDACVAKQSWLCKKPIDAVRNDFDTACYYNHPERSIDIRPDTDYLIWTPTYPQYYPYDLSCIWLLQSEMDTQIRVEIQDIFFLCDLDTLTFGDGHNPSDNSSIILSRQRLMKTRVLYSKSNQMWISWAPVACPLTTLFEALKLFLDYESTYSTMDYKLPFPFLEPEKDESIPENKTDYVTYGFLMTLTSIPNDEFIPCPRDTYTCADGGCALQSSLCNNLQDCADNSDEDICKSGEFQLAPTFDVFDQYQELDLPSDGTVTIIISPNYPAPYLNYLNAFWVITAPSAASQVRLEIKDFQTQHRLDGVKIGDGSTPGEDQVWVGTDSTKLRVVNSRAESLWIQMITSKGTTQKGFVLYAEVFSDTESGLVCIDYGYKCNHNGYCINHEGICDGVAACPDETDEYECHCESMDIEFTAGECHLPLGLQHGVISDDQITASSYLNDSYQPHYARLRNESYWAPEADDIDPWIQIRFNRPIIVSVLAIQGAGLDGLWVPALTIRYSADGEKWETYNHVLENTHLLGGNIDPLCPHVIHLNLAIHTQYIRIYPVAPDNEIGMRLELFGCNSNDCDYTFSMISGDIDHEQIRASSSYSFLNDYTTARIALLNQHGFGWIPASDDGDPWLEITLDYVHTVVAVITQGCGNEDFWVTKYSISYTKRSTRWLDYMAGSGKKIFGGNSNRNEAVKNYLAPSIEALRVRIHPESWHRGICIRWELSGCASEIPECAIGHSACNSIHQCNAPTARIASAGYPHTYYIRSRCAWQIQTPVGTFISATFLHFDIPAWDECESTYVSIYDGLTDAQDSLGSYCNKRLPPSGGLTSGFNEMFVRFQAGQEDPGTGFVMEYNSQSFMESNSTDEHSEVLCAEDWIPRDGTCYKFVKEEQPIKWTSAEENCKIEGAHLASISDENEMNFIQSLLIENRVSRWSKCYIGLRLSDSSSAYKWTNGRPLSYADWFAPQSLDKWELRQPDGGHLEACTVIELASLHSTNNWKDVPCASEETNQYVCATTAVLDENGAKPAEGVAWLPSAGTECSMFTCVESGECIHKTYVCNGYNDCKDGSDEQSCKTGINVDLRPYEVDRSCLPGRFLCGSGECVSISYVCDFTTHCLDNSDEEWCYHRSCSASEFRCENGQCIDRFLRCDLSPDCADVSDEHQCEETKFGFQCYDGTWIPLHRYCDGHRDCSGKNWEDEPFNCVKESCGMEELQCNNGACVAAHTQCQYGTGCQDATHLQHCEHFECANITIKCPSSYCIQLSHRCNGVMDCPNGEDELSCDVFQCPGSYRCHGNIFCIQQSQVCDGFRNCPDGDDELFCGLPCPNSCHCDGLYYECEGITYSPALNITQHARELHLTDIVYTGHEPEQRIARNSLLLNLQIFKSLVVLEVSRASIYHVLPGVFLPHRNLRQLNLKDNQINLLLNATFEGLSSLQFLDISGNPIINIHRGSFLSLNMLLFLDIRSTQIKRPTPEMFHDLQQLDTLYSDKYVFCCMVKDLPNLQDCLPEADQFSSCEDLMRNQVLRIFMWILGISALLGNGFVIFWRIIPHGQTKVKKSKASIVQSTLVLNLAMADGLMGVYMLIIAIADMMYRGVYIVYAEDWKQSAICKIAGFLSVLSSETSVFFMTIISVDRFLSILMPFSNFNLTPKTARLSALMIWGLAFIVSIIPVLIQGYFGSEYYGRSSVCLALPLTTERPAGWEYSVALFLCVNLLAFTLILFCYSSIYILVKLSARTTTNTRKNSLSQQLEFAARMAFLVGTDFICWMPIIIMGFLSLTGAATIPPIVYVWSAVFLLPINSSLNPYLFTILTREMSKQKAKKLKRETTKSSVVSSRGDAHDEYHTDMKLSNIATKHLIPMINNPVILSKALDEGAVTLTSDDIEIIERDIRRAYDQRAQNGMKIVTKDNILIDKPPQGSVRQAFLMIEFGKSQSDQRHTTSASFRNGDAVNADGDQLRDLFDKLRARIE